jgi:hypothetical protein
VIERIARPIDSAIRLVLSGGPASEWAEALSISRHEFSKIQEGFYVGAFPVRLDVPGELVRIYADLDDLILIPVIRQAIRMTLLPFLEVGWEITANDTDEGFKIFLGEDREKHLFHASFPASRVLSLSPSASGVSR